MTSQLATIPTGSTLKSGWKYLFTSWAIIVLMVLVAIGLSKLFPDTGRAPRMLISFFATPWVNVLASLMVAGLILAPAAGYLLAAIVMSIKSMVKRQGGMALFLTSTFGSYAAFLIGSFSLYFLLLIISGNTH